MKKAIIVILICVGILLLSFLVTSYFPNITPRWNWTIVGFVDGFIIVFFLYRWVKDNNLKKKHRQQITVAKEIAISHGYKLDEIDIDGETNPQHEDYGETVFHLHKDTDTGKKINMTLDWFYISIHDTRRDEELRLKYPLDGYTLEAIDNEETGLLEKYKPK